MREIRLRGTVPYLAQGRLSGQCLSREIDRGAAPMRERALSGARAPGVAHPCAGPRLTRRVPQLAVCRTASAPSGLSGSGAALRSCSRTASQRSRPPAFAA